MPIKTLLALCKVPESELVPSPSAPSTPARQGHSHKSSASSLFVGTPAAATGDVTASASSSAAAAAGGSSASSSAAVVPAAAALVGGTTASTAKFTNAINNMVSGLPGSLRIRRLRGKGDATLSSRSKDDDKQPHRRLIFCGHSVSGEVAHLAAIFARYGEKKERNTLLHYKLYFFLAAAVDANSVTTILRSHDHVQKVRAVTFSTPCCVSQRLAENLRMKRKERNKIIKIHDLDRDGTFQDHVTFCCDDDPVLEIATLAAEVSSARALRQDTSADAYRIVGLAERLISDSISSSGPLNVDVPTLDNDVRNASSMVRANEIDSADVKLVPCGV